MREPSPMAQEVLVAQPYAFLDNAPLEERRVHAVYSRRWTGLEDAASMAKLDPAAIWKVKDEIWPKVRSTDELYEALMVSGFLTEEEIEQKGELQNYLKMFVELAADNRVAVFVPNNSPANCWVTVERLPEIQRAFSGTTHPEIDVPEIFIKEAAKIENPLMELVRSRLGIAGPITIKELMHLFPAELSEIEQTLLALEVEGFVFRGHFLSSTEEEWCERRILARIHRNTINKLRNEIKPVSSSEFMHYLFHWQHVISEDEVDIFQRLRHVLDQLEGYEAQSVSWEGDIFPSRLKSYNYTTLDLLLMTGEYVWGRFKTGKTDSQLTNIPIRTTPVTFIKRDNLKFYIRQEKDADIQNLAVNTQKVYNLLRASGALFFFQLEERSRLLKTQLEDALTELVSVGIVTSDSFTGLRTLLIPDKYYTDKRKSGKVVFNFQQAGRWWLLTSAEADDAFSEEEYLNAAAMMLLKRYGIVFRKLVEKEKLLFMWYNLLKVYRKMEARGIIRGGRFVEGFGGEQYALPEAVSALRNIRKKEEKENYISISASDPLNLTGFITPGKRVAAFHGNRILYNNGNAVAYKEGKDVVFTLELDKETEWKLRKILLHHDIQPELRPYLVF